MEPIPIDQPDWLDKLIAWRRRQMIARLVRLKHKVAKLEEVQPTLYLPKGLVPWWGRTSYRRALLVRAHLEMFARYEVILREKGYQPAMSAVDKTSKNHLYWMCWQMSENLRTKPNYPLDKASRWLGYVQGVLIFQGYLTTERERNFSRPLFQQAYGLNPDDL